MDAVTQETMLENDQEDDLMALTADIVSAFVSNNSVRAAELTEVIAAVHASLKIVATPAPEPIAAPVPAPAVPVKKSITHDYLICLEDGKRFKSLKRHLATAFGMTPDQYRKKWGLPSDYPMVAKSFADRRSQVAKAIGLGSRKAPEVAVAAVPEPPPAPHKRRTAKPAKTAEIVAPPAAEAPAKRRGRPRKAA